jgi:alkylation response protein AidB-like acyl-CoA dehydrogenase
VQTIGAADASVALIWVMHLVHLSLVESPGFGLAAETREAMIRSSLEGPALMNALRVEPELGTPARGGVPGTTAFPTDGGWRLSGHKMYCTGSYGLRWLLVTGATAAAEAGQARLGTFIVDGRSPGIEIRETWDHLGLRASSSHDMLLSDVFVPTGWTGPLEPSATASPSGRDPVAVAEMTVLLVSVYLGVAVAARDRLVEYLHERVPSNLGAPLASLPRFQQAVGEIEISLASARRLLDGLAEDLDRGGDREQSAAEDAGPVKTAVCRAVIHACEQAVALTGNPGLSRHMPLQRHLRDALCSRVHSPQDDTIALNAGRRRLAAGGS